MQNNITTHKETYAPATENMLYQTQLQVIISASLHNLVLWHLFHNSEIDREASGEQPNEQNNLKISYAEAKQEEKQRKTKNLKNMLGTSTLISWTMKPYHG